MLCEGKEEEEEEKKLKLEVKEVLSWSNEHFFVHYIRCEVHRIRIAFRRLNFVLL
jgi:hypothetical protein